MLPDFAVFIAFLNSSGLGLRLESEVSRLNPTRCFVGLVDRGTSREQFKKSVLAALIP